MIKEVSVLRKEVESLRATVKEQNKTLLTIVSTLEMHNMAMQSMSAETHDTSVSMSQVLSQFRQLRDKLQQIVNRVEMLETVYEKT